MEYDKMKSKRVVSNPTLFFKNWYMHKKDHEN
jgi:hypothetical protein